MKTQMLSVATLCIAGFAVASENQSRDQGQSAGRQQALTFDEIKVACTNPAKFHNQAAPTNIRIACREISQRWVPDTDGSKTMATTRLVTSAIVSDKYTVAPVSQNLKSDAQAIACPRLREITETLNTERAITCDEILAFKGSSIDFCSDTLMNLKQVNPEALNVSITGQQMSLCSGQVSQDRGQR